MGPPRVCLPRFPTESPEVIEITNNSNYDGSCTLTSLPVWDLENFKRLIFIVQTVPTNVYTRRHSPEQLHLHRRQNFKSHTQIPNPRYCIFTEQTPHYVDGSSFLGNELRKETSWEN
jgi:hypothetical protein